MENKKYFKLDIKDLKLIYELEKNSRESISHIARAILVSKEVANYRLKRLIDSGFIKGFFSIIDYFSLGYESYKLLVNLYNLGLNDRKRIVDDLKKIKGVDIQTFVQSRWDIEIVVWARKSRDFYEFYDNFIEKNSKYIHNKDFSIITKIYFLGHKYLHRMHKAIVIGDHKTYEIDETDYKILDVIIENARIEITELSKILGIPSTTLNYRLRNLIAKGIIKGFIPNLNTSLLGYEKYKILITLNNPLKKKIIIQYLSQNPNVTKIYEIIGDSDLEFEVDFKSNIELDKFLEKLRVEIPYIKDFEIIMIRKI
ncbi:MAG: Lrp/AsnC family transcriptional regulator [Candidatus Aenigmatarchaeota archaeon]